MSLVFGVNLSCMAEDRLVLIPVVLYNSYQTILYQSLRDCDRQPSLRLKFDTTFILNAFMYVLFIVSLLLKIFESVHNERNIYSNTVEIGKKIRRKNNMLNTN